MTICERLFQTMEEKGKKAADLCKLLGLGTAATTAWKKRGTDPPAKYIVQIAEFLEVTPEYLLTGSDPQPVIHDRDDEMMFMFRALPGATQDFIYGSIKAAYDNEIGRQGIGQKLSY